MNVVIHQNTLAAFRMSLGTMFIKVISLIILLSTSLTLVDF
jgi:hypothetical protein